jgi:hypothetical protein
MSKYRFHLLVLDNPSSLRRAITRMVRLNILFESGGEYGFVNPFFRAWLPYKG